MAKPPPNLPESGDRVKMRGRANRGTLKTLSPETKQCAVDWDRSGPRLCHLHELEKEPTL